MAAAASSAAAAAAAATKEETEQDQLSRGPFSILMRSVKNNTQVLINLRNNHKLLGRVRAFDRHCNMVLEQVKEVWSEAPPGGGKKARPIPRDRVISKMFLRGKCRAGGARVEVGHLLVQGAGAHRRVYMAQGACGG